MLYKLTKEATLRYPRIIPMMSKTTGGETKSIESTAERYSAVTAKIHQIQERAQADSESECDDEDDVRNGNLLMVDQLWLWAVDTSKPNSICDVVGRNFIDVDLATLATFFPKRESRPSEGPLFQQADLRNSVYNELNGDLTGRCENALDLAAFVALHAVTVLLDRLSHPDLEIFRIFEEAIGMLVSYRIESQSSL